MSITRDLLQRYGTLQIPRYTSYPAANHWGVREDEAFAKEVFGSAGDRPLSLYVHVPFCHKLCLYCGCNMLVTKKKELTDRYLAALEKEMAMVAGLLRKRPKVVQLHLGGGTPTYLSPSEFRRFAGALQRVLPFGRDIEASIEVHPPVTTEEQVATLAELGFNRISMGVQDFDPAVQKRVNRIQPFEQTRDLIRMSRRNGFISVNVDLMYGLPLQTPQSFDATLDKMEELRPDRIALFGYAHLPRLRKHQGTFRPFELPSSDVRLSILERGIERLTGQGYRYIGLDHFALPEDELVKAQKDHTLRRNFMGYTTCADSDMLAFGPSSISEVNGSYVQNEHELLAWCEKIEQGNLPAAKGWGSSDDDRVRRKVIMDLFCHLEIVYAEFQQKTGIDFLEYFRPEQDALVPLERDGLVERSPARLRITPIGQLLLRNVAAVFDIYLRKAHPKSHAPAL